MSENWRAIKSSFVSAWEYQGLKEFSSVYVCVRPIEANKAERKESEGSSGIKYK